MNVYSILANWFLSRVSTVVVDNILRHSKKYGDTLESLLVSDSMCPTLSSTPHTDLSARFLFSSSWPFIRMPFSLFLHL